MQVYEGLKNLKDYLHYRIKQREYEAKVVAAKVSFEDFHRNHVKAKQVVRVEGDPSFVFIDLSPKFFTTI